MEAQVTQAAAPVAAATGPVEEVKQEAIEAVEDKKVLEDGRKPVSKAFEALARKEREIQRKSQEAKQLYSQLQTEREALEQFNQLKAKAKQNPIEALKALGITYDELTEYQLGNSSPSDKRVLELENKFEAYRAEQEAKERAALEEQRAKLSASQDEFLNQWKQEITERLQADNDKYEYINLMGAHNLVAETIQEYWEKTNKILSLDEAAKLAEEFLESEAIEFAQKSKKFQTKYGPVEFKVNEAQTKQNQSRPTLSNEMVPSSSAPSSLPNKTENDRLKRALLALGG